MIEDDGGGHRIKYIGPFSDPNDLALLFVTCVPFCVLLYSKSQTLGKLFWMSAAGFLAYGVYLTNSRGGLLALLAMIGLWSTRRVGTVATAVGAALLIPTLFAATRLAGMSAGEESAAGRVDAWYTALQLFLHHPLTGVGLGLFTEYNFLTAHNSWLLVLAEIGFFGYIAWFSVVGMSMHQMYVVGHRGQPLSPDGALGLSMFYAGIGFLVGAFFLSRSYSVMFFLFWGWTAGIYNGARLRDPSIPGVGLKDFGSRWAGVGVASIPAFYILVRILLVV